MNSKTLILVLDGAGDRPIETLNGLTPLEFAYTPNLDWIAQHGVTGNVDIIGNGRVPVSSSGALSILGYDVERDYPGETMLEALGIEGSNVQPGDIVIHVSFATGDGQSGIIDRRVCRDLSADEANILAQDITNHIVLSAPVDIKLLNYRYYRNVLILHPKDGCVISDQVSNTDPAHRRDGYFDVPNDTYEMRILPCYPVVDTDAARRTAILVNEFINQTNKYLFQHPINLKRRTDGRPEANIVITRNASSLVPNLVPFPKSLGMIVEMPGERAVGQLIGARFVIHSFLVEPSKEFYLDLAKQVIKCLNEDDIEVLYVHTKGPDEPGHDGDAKRKVAVIEMLDKYFLKEILAQVATGEHILIVTSDHATPCDLRIHSSDSVPIAMIKPGIQSDSVRKYGESYCAQGRLGLIRGSDILKLIEVIS